MHGGQEPVSILVTTYQQHPEQCLVLDGYSRNINILNKWIFWNCLCIGSVPTQWAQRWANPDSALEELIAQWGDPQNQGFICSLSTWAPPTVESEPRCKETHIGKFQHVSLRGRGERKQEITTFPLWAIPPARRDPNTSFSHQTDTALGTEIHWWIKAALVLKWISL